MNRIRVTSNREVRTRRHKASHRRTGWLQFLLNWYFILSGIDPFLVYKLDGRHTHSCRLIEVHMPPQRHDRMRKISRTIIALICLPIASHLFILGYVGALAGIWVKNVNDRQGDSDRHGASDWTLSWFHQISLSIDDPLARSPQLASFVYLASSLSVVVSLVAIPMYSTRFPFDASASRFLMRPKLEVKRIERLVRQQLRNIQSSFQEFGNCFGRTAEEKRIQFAIASPKERRTIRRLESQYRVVSRDQLGGRPMRELRPPSYSSEGYKRLEDFCKLLIYLLTFFAAIMGAFMCSSIIIIAGAEDLNQDILTIIRRFDFSNPLGRLNWNQKFTLVELLVFIVLSCAGVTIVTGTLVFQMREQLDWIDTTSKELSWLLADLRDRLPMEVDDEAARRTDLLLLKALVHVNIFGQLARRSTRMQTKLTSLLAAIALVCLTFLLGSRVLVQPDIYSDLQTLLIACVWANTNALLLMASSMPSRVITMKKFVWSILAEQARANELEASAGSVFEDPLAILWRKLVLNHEFIANQHPVRALGVGLTFSRVLQANFLLLSISSWLQTVVRAKNGPASAD